MRSYWLGRTIVSAVIVAITENDDFGAGVAMLLVVLVVNLLPHDGGSDHLDRRQGGQVLRAAFESDDDDLKGSIRRGEATAATLGGADR
jgi:hypothetical protein